MFSNNSIIKEVNIITKVVCYIMTIVCLVLCREPLFLLFVNLFLVIITKQYNNLFKINIINILITLLCIYFSLFLWITKTLILIIYTMLLKKVTKSVELRYLLENSLYRFQSKRITYRILYIIYFIKYYKNNITNMIVLKDDYGIKLGLKFIFFIIKKAYYKTVIQMKEFMITNKLRFYNYYKNRTYLEKPTWESWDNNYLIAHVIILLLTVFYGR